MPTETRGSVRQRKAQAGTAPAADNLPPLNARVTELNSSDDETEPLQEEPKAKPSARARAEDEDQYSPWLDVLRVLTFLVVASAGLSYLISSGDSLTWGLKQPPKYLWKDWWLEQFKSPLLLDLAELSQYDGTDPEKPIYLAINGTIYDVSANRRTYGPGGSYHVFAGTDAARGFVTGCFGEDRTADLRGAELMHIPVDDPEVDRKYTAVELRAVKERELVEAREKVHEQLLHWTTFFAKSPKYSRVGTVKREKGWLEREPRKKLCEQAEKSRPTRKAPGEE